MCFPSKSRVDNGHANMFSVYTIWPSNFIHIQAYYDVFKHFRQKPIFSSFWSNSATNGFYNRVVMHKLLARAKVLKWPNENLRRQMPLNVKSTSDDVNMFSLYIIFHLNWLSNWELPLLYNFCSFVQKKSILQTL